MRRKTQTILAVGNVGIRDSHMFRTFAVICSIGIFILVIRGFQT